jgi:hypothetical protein
MTSETVKARLLIISDTHGNDLGVGSKAKSKEPQDPVDGSPAPFDPRTAKADIVLHCGDLTQSCQSKELERTLNFLKVIDAPLKLIIPGNHDWDLEPGYWRTHDDFWRGGDDVGGVPEHAARLSEQQDNADTTRCWALLKAARRDGIYFLPHGVHTFTVRPRMRQSEGSEPAEAMTRTQSAVFRIFASPMTPEYGSWGFQYHPSDYEWRIPSGMDVVMTHGPAYGVVDRAWRGVHAGCGGLLAALEASRPRIHCCGHIHEAWGAQKISWAHPAKEEVKATQSEGIVGFSGEMVPILEDLVNEKESPIISELERKSGGEFALLKSLKSALANSTRTSTEVKIEDGCCVADITPDGDHHVERGSQTLFVNAAVMTVRYKPVQQPWLVDIDLSVATTPELKAAQQHMKRFQT